MEQYALELNVIPVIPERYEALNAAGSASLSGPDLFPVDFRSKEKNINLLIDRNKVSQVRRTPR